MKKTLPLLLLLLLFLCACNSDEADTTHRHSWSAATCTAPKTCKTCGETTGTEADHDWAVATCTAPITCQLCNATSGQPLDHDWNDSTCTLPMTCTICGSTLGNEKGHTWVDATCTKAKSCNVCGITEGSALGHNLSDWIIETNSTCLSDGSRYKTCSTCSTIVRKESIPAAHTPSQWFVDEGNLDSIYHHWRYCAQCGEMTDRDYHVFNSSGACTVCAQACQYTSGFYFTELRSFDYVSLWLEGIGSVTDTDIIIPPFFEGLPVNTINPAFSGTRITSLAIPDNILINGSSFKDCASLKTVYLGDHCYVENNCFNGCTSLRNLYLSKGLYSIAGAAFYRCSIENVYITDLSAWLSIRMHEYFYSNPLSTGAKLHLNGHFLTDITIPEDITVIQQFAFQGYGHLKHLTIGRQVTEIQTGAFEGTNLNGIVIPGSVTRIGSRAFGEGVIYCETQEPLLAWAHDWNGNATVYWGDEWEYVNGKPTLK